MGLIDGNLIKEHIKNECQQYKSQLQGKEITIIRFEASENLPLARKARYEAARVSAEQKVKIFNAIGVSSNYIILPENSPVEDFKNIIYSINDNDKITTAIVQYPIPFQFQESIRLLSPIKDIDCVRQQPNMLFLAAATSEGIARLVESYADSQSKVAVIGGGGFVGNGVIQYLAQRGIESFILEINDDKSLTAQADIVVTVTGEPGAMTQYILPQHRLVVDAGFTPTVNAPLGDIDKSAYSIPQNITPVPGGVGPIEMAILAERFIKMELNIELPKWNYQELLEQQTQIARVIAPVIKNLFDRLVISDRDTNTQNLQRIDKDRLGVEVGEYKLILNLADSLLTLTRNQDTLPLIKLGYGDTQIYLARGLTQQDKANWLKIGNFLAQREQQIIIEPEI
ncbi:bifunctional 5,10-methylenetetrahydrofolate dehydrogenase/5,10-methenyltetrahydrofolate cyclohydrolase [Nostoc sp. TCL26-01]|uniref:bifunctional 5,10-methylenetetrahydrofolate dehydrogenase/5,10-methenyltetrahydrofolate cyclohydrolase n=1 Tax=Nostoc sp. TCL26-01 TaxID=2576904 RepID=UPI0015C0DD36|nr:bifunctional 5,10-methylenetetrahydrofolate dehydrogenase/5,10-methenyltetrahydrofolate cyclohydrolase [Nostoc sp. TCL26-01]QLE59615.1 bifunctional 5,10-methylenetetrahydrofolate dehydrogenase/5,10-methenyltetrahydrofolate cyclohydrolase [Nostoc sp. TCL26-01]QLE59642.1 bifunctional 5,10-methylenetetrahydrofolate dehydrogenase/5,10-methenyltetrahydrofolate cyclohydrolase [Nostoc sp. TCL26-01]